NLYRLPSTSRVPLPELNLWKSPLLGKSYLTILLRKRVLEGRDVRRVQRWRLEDAAGCEYVCRGGVRALTHLPPGAGTGCQAGVKRAVAWLLASLCFPSRVGLMTALIMPDGSHQSSFNSRKTSKYCL
uniref:Uncharacterized protein n=1 Tax=Calidris pygmaea TaxID=425635 RepID=A0A8C3JPZ6_9CHAR